MTSNYSCSFSQWDSKIEKRLATVNDAYKNLYPIVIFSRTFYLSNQLFIFIYNDNKERIIIFVTIITILKRDQIFTMREALYSLFKSCSSF